MLNEAKVTDKDDSSKKLSGNDMYRTHNKVVNYVFVTIK